MQTEGWPAQQIDNAASRFVQTYQQLNATSIIGDGSDPVSAAAGFVSVGSTIAGAAGVVGSLVSAASSGSVPKALNSIMGLVVAAAPAAAAAGAVSFGVGAAIVAGAAIVEGVLSQLFGSPPQPEGSVGNCAYYGNSGPPTITDNYVWSWPAGGIVSGGPGNGAWRRFPDPAVPTNSGWFAPYTMPGQVSEVGATQTWMWSGSPQGHVDQWYACFTIPTDDGKRPIDQACYEQGSSVYHHLECEISLANGAGSALAAFQIAFFAAWKANREYGLNGLVQRPDWEVLQQTLILWNNAHSSSQKITIQPSNEAPLGATVGCPSSITPYVSILLGQSAAKMSGSFLLPNGGASLNIGPIKTQVDGTESGIFKLRSPSKTSGLAIVGGAIAVVAVAAGGFSLWAFLTGQAQSEAWKKLGRTIWDEAAKSGEPLVSANPLKGAKLLGAGEAAEDRKRSSLKVQSLLFPKSEFTVAQAKAWARAHKFKAAKVEGQGEYHRIRQFSPARSTVLRTINFGDSGVKAVVAR
jgi:hypothetical protein